MKKMFILLLVISLGVSAQAASWDFQTEWGWPTMPTPTWQYGYSNQNNWHEFILYTYASPWDNGVYWGPGPDALGVGPLMWRNDSAAWLGGALPGEVVSHTGVTGFYLGNWENVNALWTAPAGIAETVNCIFRLGSGNGGEREFWIVKNAGTASEELLFHQDPVAGDITTHLIIPVVAGDTLNFVQGAGLEMNSEASPLYVNISERVEPADPVECVLRLDAAHGLTDPIRAFPSWMEMW